MRSTVLMLAAASLITLAGAEAKAGEMPGVDRHKVADLDESAEGRLRQRLQAEPDDPVILAQLARLYAATDRPAKARRLYRALMTLEDVELERADGPPVSSRSLAATALKRLDIAKPVRMGLR